MLFQVPLFCGFVFTQIAWILNFFVNRLPVGCEDDAEDDPTATKFKWENGYLNGAAFKMEKVNQFFLGEVGTCI